MRRERKKGALNDPVNYGLCLGCGVLRRPVCFLLLRHEGDDGMNVKISVKKLFNL
jgi:hypothetical protein